MENLVLLIVIFVVAIIIAIKSAEIFIDNLVDVGSALGISEIVLGVTASAIGSFSFRIWTCNDRHIHW